MKSNTAPTPAAKMVRAALVLGDQLSLDNPVLAALNKDRDLVVMVEAYAEASQVWSHKSRIALFFSAMRHFAQTLRQTGYRVEYIELDSAVTTGLVEQYVACLQKHAIQQALCLEPGDWRLKEQLQSQFKAAAITVQLPEDPHFLCDHAEFSAWATGLKSLRMEFFYRNMRRKHKVLLDAAGEPEGGQWNFDADNRKGFPKSGPGEIASPAFFAPDDITKTVIALVQQSFPNHPGETDHFSWPTTRADALIALATFVKTRLADFGTHQDAMWTDLPFGWHSLVGSSLNLKLLDPREVVAAAEAAWRASLKTKAPIGLAAVEGFIRQVLGWREFIRGVYWFDMPKLKSDNHYQHERALPKWYWTGQTQMRCMQQTIGQTLKYGYAHHIQRLMVTGNFALLAEVLPQAVADWYLAVYIDAIEWVELPNVAGMALYANGGRFTSKPYVASGAYVKRMSNYCSGCQYSPEVRHGAKACPFTTLYWNFLDKHESEFARNPRTILMAKSVQRLDDAERVAIRDHAQLLLSNLDTI
jgi:deoxyribodipyrimidine photolyase-related protein